MSLVVFLRGVNVGGHKTFRPAELAREMAPLDVINIGAAGTFVVRGKIGAKAMRDEILSRLPFKPEVMVCPGRDILEMVRREPFGRGAVKSGFKWFLSVLARAPRPLPRLPIERPTSAAWEVQVFSISGRYAFSRWQRQDRGKLYPNEVVEKALGVPATTRAWSTLLQIHALLD